MPIPSEVRKILQGGAWASAGGALVQDPSAATPAVSRADGYGAAYSSTLVPEQETIQGRWNEFDSAIIDIFESGVPFYDAMIDYPVNAIVNEAGVLSRALVANGPTAGNAIAPSADTGGTTWARVSGTTSAPGRPAQPTATSPAPGTLAVSWNCPLDGGSAITQFVFQYREAGGAWPGTERTVTVPFVELTGLTTGQAYEFRVMAVNAIGDSPWSLTGTGTPTASAPSGGSTLALRATAGDGEVVLDWIEPDTGGSPITEYRVQWAGPGQSFTASRQRTVMGATTETVPNLTNGTEYRFQVIAVNGVGASTPSNEASASPRGDLFPTGGLFVRDDSMTHADYIAGRLNGNTSWSLGPGTYFVGVQPLWRGGFITRPDILVDGAASTSATAVQLVGDASSGFSFGAGGTAATAIDAAAVYVAPGGTKTLSLSTPSSVLAGVVFESMTLFAVRISDA